MSSSLEQITRAARREQLKVIEGVQEEGGGDLGIVGARRARRRSLESPRIELAEIHDSPFLEMYREVLGRLRDLIDTYDVSRREDFFHAMNWMQRLGLRSDDVIGSLAYSQESICRYMAGTRCPHQEVRRHILRKCFAILQMKVVKETSIVEGPQDSAFSTPDTPNLISIGGG